MNETTLDKAQRLVDRIQGDTLAQVAKQIEADEKQRAQWQARVDSLPAMERQYEQLRQDIGALTNEIKAVQAKQATLANMQQKLVLLESDIISVRRLAQELLQ